MHSHRVWGEGERGVCTNVVLTMPGGKWDGEDALSVREERKGRARRKVILEKPMRAGRTAGEAIRGEGMWVMPGGEMVWCLHGNREL